MQINVVFEGDDHFSSEVKTQFWHEICDLVQYYDCDLRLTFSEVCSDVRK